MAKTKEKSDARVPGGKSLDQAAKAQGKTSTGFDAPPSHVASEEPAKEIKKEIAPKPFERTFSKTREIVSDVFRLEAAPVMKQVGIETDYNKDPDSFRNFDHTHVFRTFDSDGKRHDRCCSTAGHFHDVVWEYDEAGKPVVASVSGPRTMSRKMVKGKWVQVSAPINNFDDHTHDITYLQSHKVPARTTNIEATKVIAANAQLGANPGAVSERG